MRAVLQRVGSASVSVGGERVAEIGPGLLALVAVARGDDDSDASELARKLVHLRLFEDDAGRMNRSLCDTGGELCVVSQFTLLGDVRKGRRPSYADAAPPEQAAPLVEAVVAAARACDVRVVTGRFGERMEVALVNSGPVTLVVDTRPGP
jgi:D-tyrosyl-tRNA(Tyr) deacylase